MIYLITFCLIVFCTFSGILLLFKYYGNKYIVKAQNLSDKYDTVIVLGAGVRPDGNPCDLLADRLDNGCEVFINGKCKNILLTGDNSGDHYNELEVMKNWVLNNYASDKLGEEELLIDNFGFCTYDSMFRAKSIFNIKTAIISTNKYHLPRAIYVARRMGIEAYGIPSDRRIYDRMKKYKKRELLAQIKDFFLCLIKIH